MQVNFHLVSDPSFLLTSNPNADISIPSNHTKFFSPVRYRDPHSPVQKSIRCAGNRRNRFGIGKSGKIVFESACIMASKLGLLPEPLELMLREFGAGNGGGNKFCSGFGWGGFDGWKRRRRVKLGMVVGILVICSLVGMWLVVGKELMLDADALFGGLGLILFGGSVVGWRRGAKDWILGFCCCVFLVSLILRNGHLRTCVGWLGTTKKNIRRRRRKHFEFEL